MCQNNLSCAIKYIDMKNKQIDGAYLASLSEEELLEEQKNWTEEQIHQYFCPNGTVTVEEFREYGYKMIDKYIPKCLGQKFKKNSRNHCSEKKA